MVDDLWLYQYHKIKYKGIVKDVFKTISFVEEKQWEIIGLSDMLESIEEEIEVMPKYNTFSNKAYM